jgi:carboxyl-terminal processing protease
MGACYMCSWNGGCLLLILCSITQFASAQTRAEGKLAVGARAFAASKIYSLMQLYFSGWKSLPELDLDIAYRNYLERALAADDRREFDLATMEFVARLRNGHTVLWDSWLTKNYGQSVGFYARPLDGKWVVQTSLMPSIKAGDVLSKIDGIEAETFFRRQQKYISGSNEAAQRHNLFFLPYLFPGRFTLTFEGGRSVEVDRTANNLPAEGKTSPEGRWLTKETIAYIRIPSFAEPLFEEKALAQILRFEKAKTLIVDVRNNAGGLMPTRLLKALMDRTYRDWKESTPIHISALELSDKINKSGQQKGMPDYEKGYLAASAAFFGGSQLEWGGDLVPPDGPVFHGQIIFLVDGGCASACEELAGPFKENHRGTLVGETTEGSSGPVYMQDLGDGMKVGIAARRQYFPDGSEFEGVGIKPDVEVKPSLEDLRSGRDTALEKALALAGQAGMSQ